MPGLRVRLIKGSEYSIGGSDAGGSKRSLHAYACGKNRSPLRVVPFVLVAVVFLWSSFANAAIAKVNTGHASVVTKPDTAFFSGKTITFIVPNPPGTTESQTAVAVGQGMG